MKSLAFAPAVARAVVSQPKPSPLALARTCDCGNHASGGGTCAACAAEKDKRKRVSRFAERPAAPPVPAARAASSAVPAVVHDVLRESGERLPGDLRAFMEPRFGTDFSDVRLHTDGAAAQSSRAVSARAYTVGPHIVFGAGQFQPASAAGRRLLAHELTHVVQQRGSGGGSGFDAPETISDPADASEHEAEAIADRVLSSGPAAGAAEPLTIAQPAVGVQRLTDDEKLGLGIGLGVVGAAGLGTLIAFLAGAFDTEKFTAEQLTAYLDGLATRRTPEGDRDSDNKARDVVRHWEAGDKMIDVAKGHTAKAGGTLSANGLKRLLIREMLDGNTGGADEEAILAILRKSEPDDLLDILDPSKGVTIQKLDDKIGGDNHAAFEKLLEEKFPQGSPVRGAEHPSGGCTARQGLMVSYAQKEAVRWVENAIRVLPRLDDAAVKQAMECRFPGASDRQRFDIFKIFERTLDKLGTRQYFCGLESGVNALEPTVLKTPDGDLVADCLTEEADSFVKKGKSTTFPQVFLCGAFFKREPFQQALTLVHESVHAAGLLEDPAYQPGCGLKLETALRNPDSFAYLAGDLMALTGQTIDADARAKLPAVSVGNFRNKGPVSEENASALGQEIPGLGPDENTGLNLMELRGDISGKAEKVQFDFRRTKEMAIWWKGNADWTRDVYTPPGKDDDALNRDESLTPTKGHIYTLDGAGLPDLGMPLGPRMSSKAKEAVYKASFLEFVEARVPPAGWTRVSNEFAWHTVTWLEKKGGLWERKAGKNEIEAGPLKIGDEPPEPVAAAAPEAPTGTPVTQPGNAPTPTPSPDAPVPGDTP